MALLARFFHISDLHLDPEIDTTAWARRLRRRLAISDEHLLKRVLTVIGGVVGHDETAALALATTWNHRDMSVPTYLIATGDLTTCGSPVELGLAANFLGGRASVMREGIPVGLWHTPWNDFAVPGNHDHWGGRMWPFLWSAPHADLNRVYHNSLSLHTVPAGSGSICGCSYPRTMDPPLPIPSAAATIRFLAIDTDAECGPFDRMMAWGRFEGAIQALRDAIAPSPEPGELRVLLLHHSLSYSHQTNQPHLRMVDGSADLLRKFIVDYEIKVLLCGHTHHPYIERFNVQENGRALQVLEACCGTTTQKVTFEDPSLLAVMRHQNGRIGQNSLLVHEIHDENGAVEWRSEAWFHGRDEEFKPYSTFPDYQSLHYLHGGI